MQENPLSLNYEIVDIFMLIQECIEVLVLKALQKGLSLQAANHKVHAPFLIEIDQNRFKQIMINLISNSIKYTSDGFIRVEVSKVDNKVHVAVVDSGIGMTKE